LVSRLILFFPTPFFCPLCFLRSMLPSFLIFPPLLGGFFPGSVFSPRVTYSRAVPSLPPGFCSPCRAAFLPADSSPLPSKGALSFFCPPHSFKICSVRGIGRDVVFSLCLFPPGFSGGRLFFPNFAGRGKPLPWRTFSRVCFFP